jgi:N-acetylneuraminic acid mutarotase
MAQRALPPGAIRRRTAFGLFEADGWTWATIKATFWFLLIIFMLGYLPDRAYYFTVSPTIDLGYNAISPLNWCHERNGGLPCPAPAGAIVPWAASPAEVALPEPRADGAAFSVGENLYLAGGRTATGVTANVLGTVVSEEGNLGAWTEAAALDQPRADGSVVVASGVPYYIGGVDGSGAPSTAVLRGVLTEGALSSWEAATDLQLPVAVTDGMAVATTGGIYLFGGRVNGALSQAVYRAALDDSGELLAWTELTEMRLSEARADGTAVSVGNFVYLLGGEGPQGASNSVFFLALDNEGAPVVDAATGRPQGWGVSVEQAAVYALPEARMRHMSIANSGAMYVFGGVGVDGQLVDTTYWAVPTTASGTIPAWRQLEVTDLPEPRADAGAVALASHVFLLGGETPAGPTNANVRANLAPALPFFRLGMFGVTVPALSIKGEIGQQLGYIAAGTVALGNLVLLILIGIAFAHQRATLRLIQRISRGRYRAPPEEEPA